MSRGERPPVDRRSARERAAAMLREVIEAVDAGDLDAPGPQGARLLRRMEGAVVAWDAETLPENRRSAR